MPITAFSSLTDGLGSNQRSREHFVANINVDDERCWVPYAEGVWFQPCRFNVTSGGFSVVLKGLPGAKLGVHYHVGTVHGYTMRGHWRYLEHDWIAKPGTFIYEPAGEAHTLVITDDSPEPALIFFVRRGRPHLFGQVAQRRLYCLRGRIHHARVDSEVLSRGRSRCAPTGHARSLVEARGLTPIKPGRSTAKGSPDGNFLFPFTDPQNGNSDPLQSSNFSSGGGLISYQVFQCWISSVGGESCV